MEAINAEMQKQFKLTAKKKLYFALAMMFHESRQYLVNLCDGAQKLQQMALEDGSPEEIQKAALMALAPLVMAVRPVYCLAESLRSYQQAMGEYPEFTKFMVKNEADLPIAIEKTLGIIDETQKLLDMLADKENPAPKLRNGAFGKDFIAACERIKIKGEV